MFDRIVPLALLLAGLVGCSKNNSEAKLTGPDYTLTLRSERQGDKTHVIQKSSRNATIKTTARGGSSSHTEGDGEQYEFTENIQEMPAGAERPTKYTRAFKEAALGNISASGQRFSFSGKTVTVEKSPMGYTINADGQPLPPLEDVRFRKVFAREVIVKNEDMLPAKPVKVNETWNLDAGALARISRIFPFTVEADKSRATGKLIKVYTKDERQWSVIELSMELAVVVPVGHLNAFGTLTVDISLDAVTDGSVNEGSLKATASGKLTGGVGYGSGVEIDLKAETTETRTPVK